MSKRLSEPRFALLQRAISNDGRLAGRHMSTPCRGLASRMSGDKLCMWSNELGWKTKNLDQWTLRITEAGRTAVTSEHQRRERAGKRGEMEG